MAKISLRMDVDSAKCLLVGLPNILKLCEQFNVPVAIFILPGKAINRIDLFARSEQGKNSSMKGNSLGPKTKLGYGWLARTLILNESLYKIIPKVSHLFHSELVTIGLHGGFNHSSWCRGMDSEKNNLDVQINWGLSKIGKFLAKNPGFASPCGLTPSNLESVLVSSGFKYLADDIRQGKHDSFYSRSGIKRIPTGICGPGGEGFFEMCTARRLSFREMMFLFDKLLGGADNAVVYDHPFFAGDKGLEMLSYFIKSVNSRGHTWSPMMQQ